MTSPNNRTHASIHVVIDSDERFVALPRVSVIYNITLLTDRRVESYPVWVRSSQLESNPSELVEQKNPYLHFLKWDEKNERVDGMWVCSLSRDMWGYPVPDTFECGADQMVPAVWIQAAATVNVSIVLGGVPA